MLKSVKALDSYLRGGSIFANDLVTQQIMETINLQIGEFSKLCGVTVKTLHHYEKLGLIAPAEVDPWTGYRYYRVDQMQTMQTIGHLKELGFSLEEIGDLMSSACQTPPLDLLEAKIRQTEAELRMMLLRRDRLQQTLSSQQKYHNMEQFTIESIPAMTVACYHGILPSYSDLGTLCVNVIGPEMARLGCECPDPGYCYTVELDKEYKGRDIDFEYCERVLVAKEDSDIIHFRHNPEVPMAVCMKVFGPYDRLYQSYPDLFAYIEREGYQIEGAPRACYVDGIWNQSDPEKWLTIIQVPVQKVQPVQAPTANRLKLFCNPVNGEVFVGYGNAKMTGDGSIVDALPIKPAEAQERPTISEIDGEYLLEYDHPMTKDFYIAGVVAELYDRVELFRLFPEQSAQVRLSQLVGTKLYTIYRQCEKVWATVQTGLKVQ